VGQHLLLLVDLERAGVGDTGRRFGFVFLAGPANQSPDANGLRSSALNCADM